MPRLSLPRLLTPVLRFLFHVPEIEYFSGFQGFLQYYFFCTGIHVCSGFIFGPQNCIQDSCRKSGFLLNIGIITYVLGFYSDGLPISTICLCQMVSQVVLVSGQLEGRALILTLSN